MTKFRISTISLATLALSVGAIPLVFMLGASAAKAAPMPAQISIGVRVNLAPPPLPVYEQPPCPGPDYIWTPGYWAWDGNDYYWVPGTWVEAPDPGLFWTPGYWAWGDGGYAFVPGYWGPTVGFYGGIDYGFGYGGHGYVGGRWTNGHFFYNTAVNNVNVTVVHNTYVNRNVVAHNNNRVSFNGGNGGVNARATSQEEAAARAHHIGPVAAQTQQAQAARNDQQLHASYNHGAPPVAATSRAGNFSGSGVVAAHNAATTTTPATRTENPPANRSNTPPNQPRQAAPQTNRQQIQRKPAPNRQTAPQNTPQQQHPQARPAPQMQRQTEPRQAPEQRSAPSQEQRTQPQSHPQPERHTQPQQHPAPQHAQPQQRAQPQQQHEERDQH
jgi:hypothetical protein